MGARAGGSCSVNASSALVWLEANCAVTVLARTRYAVAGSSPDIVAPSTLQIEMDEMKLNIESFSLLNLSYCD